MVVVAVAFAVVATWITRCFNLVVYFFGPFDFTGTFWVSGRFWGLYEFGELLPYLAGFFGGVPVVDSPAVVSVDHFVPLRCPFGIYFLDASQ